MMIGTKFLLFSYVSVDNFLAVRAMLSCVDKYEARLLSIDCEEELAFTLCFLWKFKWRCGLNVRRPCYVCL